MNPTEQIGHKEIARGGSGTIGYNLLKHKIKRPSPLSSTVLIYHSNSRQGGFIIVINSRRLLSYSSLLIALGFSLACLAQNSTEATENYHVAIADIEEAYGPYDSNLPQHLMSLGLIYQAGGQHAEAAEVFERAVHVQRIGGGLYDLNQVPMLEKLIESNVARGSWDNASKNHQYLYWLHKRNFGDDDPRMLPVIDKLSNWHLNAYALDTSSGLFQHLISAHALFSMAVSIIDTNFGDDDIRLVDALRGLTISNYYLATFNSSAKSSNFESSFSNSNARNTEKAQLEQYIINSYNSGKKAIHRMMDVYAQNPEAPVTAVVSAKIELADWNLLFGRWHSAMDIYKQAYAELTQSSETTQFAEEFFGHPKALPDLPFLKGNLDTINSDMSYVLVSFDVSEHGRAKNINIVESHPKANIRIRSRVRNSLKAAKFRPRFADGKPAITAGLTHRYVFPN